MAGFVLDGVLKDAHGVEVNGAIEDVAKGSGAGGGVGEDELNDIEVVEGDE